MFRKFLLVTSFLLTLASQNGYAAISLDTPKAVLQRGTYSKVTLSFTLSNISTQELGTYEMGRAETDDGIRSIVRYLDVCVNTEAGKKCSEGPSIKKARYATNSQFDKTPELEFDNEHSISFASGSPRFEIPPEDTTQSYRNLYVTLEITSSGTPFSTGTYISIRLLPGTNTNSSDFKDAEVQPKLAVAANDVVDSLKVISSKSTLTVTWDKTERIDLKDSTQALPDGALAFYFKEDPADTSWSNATFPVRNYDQANPNDEKVQANGCRIANVDKTAGTCTIDCSSSGLSEYYLKKEDLEQAGIEVFTATNTGNLSITDLDNSTYYAIVYQNQPDGLKQACRIAIPTDAVTLSELGGGPEPTVKDPRCFIATAAYGSPLDPHLNTLRWFRDNVLLVTEYGRKLVQFYYNVSPPLADFIAARPTLRTITRGALWLPVIVIEFWRERPSLLLTVSAMAATFLLLFLRRRSLRASI